MSGEGEVGEASSLCLALPVGEQLPDLTSDGGGPGPTLVLHRLPVHADLQATAQPAAATLVPASLVHGASVSTLPDMLAGVLPASADGPLEESCAPVARKDAVVLAGAEVSAYLAWHVVQDTAGRARHRGQLLFSSRKQGGISPLR